MGGTGTILCYLTVLARVEGKNRLCWEIKYYGEGKWACCAGEILPEESCKVKTILAWIMLSNVTQDTCK